MTTIPDAIKRAPEDEVLASLARLLRAGTISATKARHIYSDYRVARSEREQAEPYLSVEIRRTQPTQPINE